MDGMKTILSVLTSVGLFSQDGNDLQVERQDQVEEVIEPRRGKRVRIEKSFGPDFVSFMVENEPTSYREATKKIIETMNVSFDELSAMAFEQRSSKPRLQCMTSRHISSLLDLTYASSTITTQQPSEGELDLLFEAMYDDYIDGQPSATARSVLPAQEPQVRQSSTASTTIADTAPIPTNSSSHATNIPITSQDVDELNPNVMDTSSGYVILCLYVDDMLIVGSNDKMIKSTKDMLKSKFDMKDMGLANVILGIKIIRTHNGLVLSQTHYVDKILNTHNAGDSGLAKTPIDTSLHLSKNKGVYIAQLEYSRIIGMLMYLMMSTRPDLAYDVSRLSRYTSNPSNAHWKAITKVLHYLRYSRDYELYYNRHHVVIEGYSDANWTSDIKDSRSTSGYMFTLGGAAKSWKSSK
nr:zinc finger, CCHC-type [Tanacetum cinerariifolium]